MTTAVKSTARPFGAIGARIRSGPRRATRSCSAATAAPPCPQARVQDAVTIGTKCGDRSPTLASEFALGHQDGRAGPPIACLHDLLAGSDVPLMADLDAIRELITAE